MTTANEPPQPPAFGLFLSTQQPPGTDMVRSLEDQLLLAHAAEDAGWDSVWGGQHYLTGDFSQFQPVPFLARLSGEVPSLRLGLGIHLLSLQNPVAAAEEIATLDVLSGGRLTYGVGLGYRDVEFAAFGFPKSEGVARLEANLRVMRSLWAGEHVTVDLPWCRLEDAALTIRRVGEPQVWMAANSDRAVRRAATMADAWLVNPHARLDTLVRQSQLYHDARTAAGLPPPAAMPVIKELFCAPTREKALQLAGPWIADKYATYAKWGQDKALPQGDDFSGDFDVLSSDRFIIGAPEDCLASLREYKTKLGATHFILRTQWPGMPVGLALDSMTLLASDVIPHLAPTVRAQPWAGATATP
jgi:alkanesulfonate monooxygenase SsuD/methylene tetrahydromethanopterin reductase-like flavin-dependent oxidoreductase (luciferase family)